MALPGRVLYAVRHSFPFASNGYAVRTHGVARVLMSDVAPLAELRGRSHNFFSFQKGQPDSLAEQIHHILITYAEPPSRCVELEQLTWKENVRPMVGAVMGC